eukprot:300780-Lingulodinium_polyedra.AAC.1
MSVSAATRGDNNTQQAYWLEPAPVPAPTFSATVYSYPAYHPPAPLGWEQWDHGAAWAADNQWAEPWPTYEAVVSDA